MKFCIYGSRGVRVSVERLDDIIRAMYPDVVIEAVVCGMAPGGDECGFAWARWKGVPVIECPADWQKHGKRAGYIRNGEMADIADAGLGLWDGSSRGTANMAAELAERGKTNVLITIKGPML